MSTAPAEKPLIETYVGWMSIAIDAEGIGTPFAVALDRDGAMTVYALALPVPDAYRMMLAEWSRKGLREMIFAFDRFTEPGQGTTLGDVMAGWHFVGDERRPFIVEYQHDPRIMKPVAWDNPFWTAALQSELGAVCREILQRSRP